MEQKATGATCICIPISTAKQDWLSQPCEGSKQSPRATGLSDKPQSGLGLPLGEGFLLSSLPSASRSNRSQQGDFHTSLEPSVQLHTAINPNHSDLKGSASF